MSSNIGEAWGAANTGNLAALKKALDAGEDIEQKDTCGRTPLVEAVKYGHADCVKELLRRGANPTATALCGPVSAYTNDKYILGLLDAYIDQHKNAKSDKENQAQPTVQAKKTVNESGPVCKFWQRGQCKFGDRCWYRHGTDGESSSARLFEKIFATAVLQEVMQGGLNYTDDSYDDSYDDSDDSYDSDDDDDCYGFNREQVNELLAQGVKPWDDDADAVLDALGYM